MPSRNEQPDSALMFEGQILAAIKDNLYLVLAIGLMGALVGIFEVSRAKDIFPVRAEMLVRIGYEYTPLASNNGTDQAQVRADMDMVLGTEVQVLSSRSTIARALDEAPRYSRDTATGTVTELSVAKAARKLSIKRIEGSNVLRLEVLDEQSEWALGFAQALVKSYLVERENLFSTAQERTQLEQNRDKQRAVHLMLSEKIAKRTLSAAEAFQTVENALSALAPSTDPIASTDPIVPVDPTVPAGPSVPIDPTAPTVAPDHDTQQLLTELLALRLQFLSDPLLADTAELLSETAGPTAGGNPNGPAPTVTPEALRAAVKTLQDYAIQMPVLFADRAAAAKNADSLDIAATRLQNRDNSDRRVSVLTAPYVSDSKTGLSNNMKIAFSALVGLALGMMIAVFLAGNRRLRLTPKD